MLQRMIPIIQKGNTKSCQKGSNNGKWPPKKAQSCNNTSNISNK